MLDIKTKISPLSLVRRKFDQFGMLGDVYYTLKLYTLLTHFYCFRTVLNMMSGGTTDLIQVLQKVERYWRLHHYMIRLSLLS